MTSSYSTRSPRTQAQRSARTKERLLEATIDCWSEFGYASTSMPSIAQRAGVTRGALDHHYPSAGELVIAAATYLTDRWSADLIAASADGELSISQQLDRLWSTHQDGICSAMIEVTIAARTDPALACHWQSVQDGLRPRNPAPPRSEPTRFPEWADTALDAICGLLMRTFTSSDPATARQAHWPQLRQHLITMIKAEAPTRSEQSSTTVPAD
ncbi:TetR/AcrR family transcriptional regulator [Nocardia sp. NPDC058379]|uniref:TetR/AcrR family transcriptional regulator n=1 Tax=unclassified Nocardia TaxID=2637762 RepID=UPI003653782E